MLPTGTNQTPRRLPGQPGRRAEQTAPIRTDPDGSYTGRPDNPWETPQQDADDL